MSRSARLFTMDAAPALDRIPVLDLGDYRAGKPGALERVAAELRDVAETVGFFYVANHGVPQALIDRAFAEDARFHALPLEQKLALRIDHNNIGYMAMDASIQRHSKVHKNTKPNKNESYFVGRDRRADDPDVLAGKPLCGINHWPSDLPGFRETIMEYFGALERLGDSLLPICARALELPADYFTAFFTPAHVNLRLLHYPAQAEIGDNEFGTAPHTDSGFLTILARMEVAGLAIRMPSGEWVPPPLIPGTFLCNIGDTFGRWTNDRFISTPHAVINDSGRDRYSMAFIYDPRLDTPIEALPTCHGPDKPPRYAPTTFGEYQINFLNTNYLHRQGKAG
jgi:isopenicillin N synthase-like dioxygenase